MVCWRTFQEKARLERALHTVMIACPQDVHCWLDLNGQDPQSARETDNAGKDRSQEAIVKCAMQLVPSLKNLNRRQKGTQSMVPNRQQVYHAVQAQTIEIEKDQV